MIPVSKPSLGTAERTYLMKAFDSTWISSSGEWLDRFEFEFARFCGSKHALGVSSGTAALHLALSALGVAPGDEVIVPSFTYVATANAVRYCGAEPVFADVEVPSWGLDPSAVASMITPRTKAIVAVHLYGHPADMAALRRLADSHGLALVEDAAEAPGAAIGERPVGSWGDIATFSFYGNKIMSSGEGGAVTTSNADLADRMRLLRGQGMDPSRRYWFPVTGFNYRMTNLAAAILCGQLENFESNLEQRWRVFRRYDMWFLGQETLELQQTVGGCTLSPWLYSILVRSHEAGRRDALTEGLLACGVDTRPFFIPLHHMPPFEGCNVSSMSRTDDLANRGLNLPTYPDLTDAEIDQVARAVLDLLE